MQSLLNVRGRQRVFWILAVCLIVLAGTAHASMKQPGAAPVPREAGGEANLILPDLGQANFLGVNASTLLMGGIGVCALGLLFGLVTFTRLKRLPVHKSMLEVSELIYETCKTYLITQVRFIGILWLFIGAIMVVYFKFLAADAAGGAHGLGHRRHHPAVQPGRHRRQRGRGLVRHPREHVREFADGVREPARQAVSAARDPARSGHEHRHAAHQRRAVHHAVHPAVHPGRAMPGRASSGLPSASRWARRRCGSPAASSPRSPTSAPT